MNVTKKRKLINPPLKGAEGDVINLSKHRFARFFFMLCLLASLFTGAAANAQTFEEWIRVARGKSKTQDNVKVTVEIKAVNGGNGGEEYTTTTTMMKRGRKFCYQMEGIEIVNDSRYQVTVNHEFRTISFFEIDDKSQQLQPEVMSLDSILGYYSNPVKISENESQVQYKVSQNSSLVKELLVSIDKQKKQINKVTYNYATPGDQEDNQRYVEMKFNTTALSNTNEKYFDIKRFVKPGKGKDNASLAEAYKGYYLEKPDQD